MSRWCRVDRGGVDGVAPACVTPMVEHESESVAAPSDDPWLAVAQLPFRHGVVERSHKLVGSIGARWSVYRRRTMRIRSGITRPFDRSLASNRFVLLASPGSGVVAGLVTLAMGDGWRVAIPHGFSAGGATFLGWALVRELHPDRLGWPVVAAMLAPPSDSFWVPLTYSPQRSHCLSHGWSPEPPGAAALAGCRHRGRVRSTGGGALLRGRRTHGIGDRAVWHPAAPGSPSRELLIAAVIVTGLAGYAWWDLKVAFDRRDARSRRTRRFRAPRAAACAAATDRSGGAISPHRVRAARCYAIVTAAALAAFSSDPSAMAPVWVALGATAARPT